MFFFANTFPAHSPPHSSISSTHQKKKNSISSNPLFTGNVHQSVKRLTFGSDEATKTQELREQQKKRRDTALHQARRVQYDSLKEMSRSNSAPSIHPLLLSDYARFPATVDYKEVELQFEFDDGKKWIILRQPLPSNLISSRKDRSDLEWCAMYATHTKHVFDYLFNNEKPEKGWVRMSGEVDENATKRGKSNRHKYSVSAVNTEITSIATDPALCMFRTLSQHIYWFRRRLLGKHMCAAIVLNDIVDKSICASSLGRLWSNPAIKKEYALFPSDGVTNYTGCFDDWSKVLPNILNPKKAVAFGELLEQEIKQHPAYLAYIEKRDRLLRCLARAANDGDTKDAEHYREKLRLLEEGWMFPAHHLKLTHGQVFLGKRPTRTAVVASLVLQTIQKAVEYKYGAQSTWLQKLHELQTVGVKKWIMDDSFNFKQVVDREPTTYWFCNENKWSKWETLDKFWERIAKPPPQQKKDKGNINSPTEEDFVVISSDSE